MRKSLIIASLAMAAALSGCGKSASDAVDTATSAVGEASGSASAAMAEAKLPVGNWDVSDSAGKKLSTVKVNADGTYSEQFADGHREAGLAKVTDGKTCFDPSGKAPEVCYTDSAPGADGSFTATDPKGVVVTVKPHA